MSDYRAELLQKELDAKDYELYALRNQYKALTQSFLNLEAEYSNIKAQYSSIASKEANYKALEAKTHEKDELIFKLSQELESMDTVFKRYKLENETQFQKEMGQLKYHYDNNLVKLENAARIEKLLPVLLDQVQDLQDIINSYDISEKKRQREREILFEKEMSDLKKKMLNYIREGQKNSRSKTAQKQELYNKLNQFNYAEVMIELEFQSCEVETLLKDRECLEKMNRELRNDLKIHLDLEKVLKEKNKKYTELIKSLSLKTIKAQPKEKEEVLVKRNKTNDRTSNTSNKTYLSQSFSMRNKTAISRDTKNQHNHPKLTNPIAIDGLKLKSQFRGCLKGSVIEQTIDYKTLLLKYEAVKAKLEAMEMKYQNVFLLFNEAFEKLSADPEMQKIREIYVNMNDFKSMKYDQMSTEQKYTVLVMLINYILPLVNKDIMEAEMQKRSIEKVQRKFFISKADPSKSFTSFQDTRTSQTSFKYSGYNSLKNFFRQSIRDDLNGTIKKPYSLLNMNLGK